MREIDFYKNIFEKYIYLRISDEQETDQHM